MVALPQLKNRWAVLALMFAARMDMAVHFQAVSPLVQPIVADLGLTQSQVGLLIGIILAPGVVLALPGGLLMQRFGDRNLLLAGQALMVAGALIFGIGASFSWGVAGRLIGGFGVVLTSLVTSKIVTDWFVNHELGTGMGLMLSAWPLGIALALSTLGAIAQWSNWHTTIALTAGVTTINFIAVAALYHERPGIVVDQGRASRLGQLWRITGRELLLIVGAGLIWMLCNSAFVLLIGFTPAFLVSRGTSVAAAGLIVGLASWPMIGSVPLGGWVLDRLKHPNWFIGLGSVASAATIALAATGRGVPVCMLLFGILGGVWAAAVMSLPGQVLSPQARGTGFGIFYGLLYGGESVAPAIAGRLQDSSGNPAAALWLAASLMALTTVVLVGFRWLQVRLPARRAIAPH